jgi:hypothetical protein
MKLMAAHNSRPPKVNDWARTRLGDHHVQIHAMSTTTFGMSLTVLVLRRRNNGNLLGLAFIKDVGDLAARQIRGSAAVRGDPFGSLSFPQLCEFP